MVWIERSEVQLLFSMDRTNWSIRALLYRHNQRSKTKSSLSCKFRTGHICVFLDCSCCNWNLKFFQVLYFIQSKALTLLLPRWCKKGASILSGQNWNNYFSFPFKNDSFPVFTLLSHLFLPKIWCSHPYKNYIFGMSYNRVIR